VTTPNEGIAWSLKTFGPWGPPLREFIPQFLYGAHQDLAVAHVDADVGTEHVYGNVGRKAAKKLPEAIADQIPGQYLDRIHLPGAGYDVVTVNEVPIYPLRYARTARDPDGCRLAYLSETREKIINGRFQASADKLALEWNEPEVSLSEDARQVAESLAQIHRDLEYIARNRRLVVLALFASNPYAFHQVGWGTGRLDKDGVLHMKAQAGRFYQAGLFYEELAWIPANRQTRGQEIRREAVGGNGRSLSSSARDTQRGGAFDEGSLQEPPLRPRGEEPPRADI